MNTLIHLIALFLLTAFAWWLFDQGETLSTMSGVGAVGLAMLITGWTIQAAVEDIGDLRGNKRRGRR